MNQLVNLVGRPIFGRVVWLAFAVLFFYSGLYFTEWLFASETFAGGFLRGTLVALFPLLVPLFFIVNRRFGCASGSCGVASGSCNVSTNPIEHADRRGTHIKITRMPGA